MAMTDAKGVCDVPKSRWGRSNCRGEVNTHLYGVSDLVRQRCSQDSKYFTLLSIVCTLSNLIECDSARRTRLVLLRYVSCRPLTRHQRASPRVSCRHMGNAPSFGIYRFTRQIWTWPETRSSRGIKIPSRPTRFVHHQLCSRGVVLIVCP